jgi:pimeloyl-ACP methyl ester carboxylesterase
MDAFAEYQPRARRIELASRGGAMAALDFGPEDRPVDIVFSHANGFNARTYRTILAPLAAEFRILAPDLRGHGASTLPAEPQDWPGWTGFAADLVALLAAATDRPVVLAGHSLGATTSLLAAGAAPERMRALVLVEPVLFDRTAEPIDLSALPITRGALRRRATFPDRAAALAAYRGRGAFVGWSEAQLADYVAAGFHDTADGEVTLACRPAWEAATYAHHDYDPWAAFAAVRCPVRILAGGRESSVGAQARELAARGGARLDLVEGATHFLPMQRPELVREALREAAAG